MNTGRPHRIFLLSPANTGGVRGRLLLRERANFDLAVRLREGAATLGETYSFISGLYFRGKLAYANAFPAAPPGTPSAFVITAGMGLVPPETSITIGQLNEIASIPIDAAEPRYREPLERHSRILDETSGGNCEFVLLGSMATTKYLEPLLGVFGQRLIAPAEFVGRGDMSRGGLMLRRARDGVELNYEPLVTLTRHGPRPPKLPKIPR